MNRNATSLLYTSLHVTDWMEKDGDLHIHAQAPAPPCCPDCFGPLQIHGKQDQRYIDAPSAGQRVTLWVERQRFRCPACKTTMRPDLPDMHEQHRVTKRLVRWLESQFRNSTNLDLAQQCGLQEKTIRQMRQRYLDQCWQALKVATPRVLGIDEIYIQNAYRCVLTDLEHGTVYDLLPSRTLDAVTHYLSQLPDRSAIEFVCVDFHGTFINACQAALPQARLVIDKFHVVKMANESLERVRKAAYLRSRSKALNEHRKPLLRRWDDLSAEEQRSLRNALRQEPDVRAAHDLKEAFYRIFDAPNAITAVPAFDAWRHSIPPNQLSAWQPLLAKFDRWHVAIFNYFRTNSPVTNGFAEWANQHLRHLNRRARGMSFELLRTRAVLECRQRTANGPILTESPFRSRASHLRSGFAIPPTLQTLRHVGMAYENLFEPWLTCADSPLSTEKSE